MVCLPWTQLTVSESTEVVSPRPCGKLLTPPNSNAPDTVICGMPTGPETPLSIPKAAGLSVLYGAKMIGNVVAAETRFIHQRRADHPGVVQRDQLTPAGPVVAHSRKAVGVGAGCFIALIRLHRVIRVEALVFRKNLTEVHSALLDVYRRRHRKGILPRPFVCRGNEGQEGFDELVAGCLRLCDLRRAQGCRREGYSLALPQCFIAQKDKRLIFLDRASAVTAELIADELRLFAGRKNAVYDDVGGVREIAGVKEIVPQVLVCFAMPRIYARTRGDIDDGAGIASVLGAESVIVNDEFTDRIDRRLKRDLLVVRIVPVNAVDHEVHSVLEASRRIERKRPLTAQWHSQVADRGPVTVPTIICGRSVKCLPFSGISCTAS